MQILSIVEPRSLPSEATIVNVMIVRRDRDMAKRLFHTDPRKRAILEISIIAGWLITIYLAYQMGNP